MICHHCRPSPSAQPQHGLAIGILGYSDGSLLHSVAQAVQTDLHQELDMLQSLKAAKDQVMQRRHDKQAAQDSLSTWKADNIAVLQEAQAAVGSKRKSGGGMLPAKRARQI